MKRRNILYLFACVMIVLSLFLGTSCIFSESPPSDTTPDVTAPPDTDWTLPPADGTSPLLPDFVTVIAKVRPSVVAINTEIIVYNIFREEGAGSGWIIDEAGYIVTNNHVVEGARTITVSLADGRSFPASIIGTDALADLAVLKIDAPDLVTAGLGNSSAVKVGEWVLAVGNPLGLGISAKEGIIGRKGVSISVSSGQTMDDLIETSAAINPGNSGGPLVNMRGEVIGITSVKMSAVGVEGMGYAISIDSAKPILEQLIQRGNINRPFLGISHIDVTPSLVRQYGLDVSTGIFVVEVVPGYPAEAAGLKVKDVIIGFDGKEIKNGQDLSLAMSSCQVG